MLVWEYPEVFSKAACFSPAFKIENIDYVSNVLSYDGEKNFFLYIDNGRIDLEARLQPGIDEMLNALGQKGYIMNEDFVWYKDANAGYSESAWPRKIVETIGFVFWKVIFY